MTSLWGWLLRVRKVTERNPSIHHRPASLSIYLYIQHSLSPTWPWPHTLDFDEAVLGRGQTDGLIIFEDKQNKTGLSIVRAWCLRSRSGTIHVGQPQLASHAPQAATWMRKLQIPFQTHKQREKGDEIGDDGLCRPVLDLSLRKINVAASPLDRIAAK